MMEVVEKTQRKIVVRQRRHAILRGVVSCLLLALFFYLLDAKHPKSSLYCTRHAVLPDNELEAMKGSHVEDIDCSLIVRPTRTALDLTFFEEIPYSFEIVGAHLIRPPKRPPDRCSKNCVGENEACCDGERGQLPNLKGGDRSVRRKLKGFNEIQQAAGEPRSGAPRRRFARRLEDVEDEDEAEVGGVESGGGGQGRGRREHHSVHWGVNDVATLILEDNEGNTYEFYTFHDEDVAEKMLSKVEAFIQEAREGVSPETVGSSTVGHARAEQAPLKLEVLYDDSWLDEMACALFFIMALVLMTRPYTEVVEFDAESGAMALDRRNLFQCGVFRYSCALENVSMLEITEGKEFGLRITFSLPLQGPGGATIASETPPGVHTASTSNYAGVGGAGSGAATPPQQNTRPSHARLFRRCWLFWRRLLLWVGEVAAGCGGRRPVTRSVGNGRGLMYLELGFGNKAQDDRKLRRPVELVNDLLLRFASGTEAAGGRQRECHTDGNCCVCFRRRARVVTLPCMHMAVCPQCSESLSACPLCRTTISDRHTVFL